MNAVLHKRGDLKLGLAKWMTFALHRGLTRGPDAQFLDLLSWVWRSAVEEPPKTDEPLPLDEARDVLRRCLAIALKNGYQLSERHIREDAQAMKLDVSDVVPAGERPREFLQKMREGFEKMLDGAFPAAQLAYRDAGAIATQRGDAFDEWVALHGEEDAALARIDLGDLASEASQAIVDAYGRRRLEMEQTGKVKDWIEKARHLRERLLQRLVERHIRQNRQRAFGGRSESFSNYPHDYWTMFRELEIISAPPALQRRYIQPLIDLGGFDAEEELRYRLQLDIDETEKAKDWISRIIDESGGTVDERRERDGNLVDELRKADVSRFERVRRLDLFPKIAPMLRTTDLDWAPSFLFDCKAALGAWIHTFHSHRVLADDYAEAWGAYAALELRAVVMDHLENVRGNDPGTHRARRAQQRA